MAITSVLMMTTHSFFNAALSRLPSPQIYISAFAVAKSLMHIFESPIMMIRQAVSTLVYNAESYFRVRKFFIILTILTVAILGITAFTGVSEWIYRNIIGVKGRVLEEAMTILIIFTFFPAAAALRNFMQGVAVILNRTLLFSFATTGRLLYVLLLIFLVEKLTFLPGAVFAGLMFFTAVALEGIIIFTGVKLTEKNIPEKIENMKEKNIHSQNQMTQIYIFKFFWPLIITSIIHMAAMPMVNMGLARSITPEIAISSFAVAWSLGLFFLSPGFMYHQLIINYYNNNKANKKSLKKFGLYMGLIIAGTLGLVSFSNIGIYILRNWIGATKTISILAIDVLKLMILLTPIILGREFYWGILMKKNKTRYVSKAKIVNIIGLVSSIIVLLIIKPHNSAIIGALAFITAEGMEVIYLNYIVNKEIYKTS
ncbi:MAG: hypothetical protein ACOCZT_03215 [Halanaerobiales bacterium]